MIWAELVKLYQKGDIRAIGVSSFNEKHFVEIEKITDIVPAVNQIEVSPYNTQKDLITFTKSKGIQVEGYSAFNGMYNASDSLFNNPVLKEFANKKCKTIAQIINRWQIQQDITIIPRSKSAYHQRENIDIFDFELSVQEMKKIDQLNQNKFVWGNPKFDYYK